MHDEPSKDICTLRKLLSLRRFEIFEVFIPALVGTCICTYPTDVKWFFTYVAVFDHIRSLLLCILLCSYFDTYGSIPELNDDDSEKKFTIMRKVTESSTIHKGDNTECLLVTLLL